MRGILLLPFIREGLEAGEKAIHVVDPEVRHGHLDRLRRGGIDVEAAQRRGQLEVKTTDEVYLRDGRFDPEATMALYEDMLKRARSEGDPLTRVIAAAPRVLAVLRTHPVAMVGGGPLENPFFAPSAPFLDAMRKGRNRGDETPCRDLGRAPAPKLEIAFATRTRRRPAPVRA